MPVGPNDFSRHADRLQSQNRDEIANRCFISRKYYSIFHEIREAKPQHFSFQGGDHGIAIQLLDRMGYPRLSNKLRSLKKRRELADYELHRVVDDKKVQKVKHDHDMLLRAIENNF